MSGKSYQKACICPRATATCGRIVLQQERLPDGSLRIFATLYPGPVCDNCDAPWLETRAATRAKWNRVSERVGSRVRLESDDWRYVKGAEE